MWLKDALLTNHSLLLLRTEEVQEVAEEGEEGEEVTEEVEGSAFIRSHSGFCALLICRYHRSNAK